MRASTACVACRIRRRKCEMSTAAAACRFCLDRGRFCKRGGPASFSLKKEKPPAQVLETSPSRISIPLPLGHKDVTDGAILSLPEQALCMELVQLYFDRIHDQFHSIFHAPTFIDSMVKGQASPAVLYGMMALSARFSTNQSFAGIPPLQRAEPYMRQSAALLDFRDISLTTIQACVLVGAACMAESESGAEAVYYSVACRIAGLLDLANRPTSDALERELNIRVWWTLCMIDVWSSTGVGLKRELDQLDHVPLPMDEATFLQWRYGERDQSDFDAAPDRGSSLLSQMIRLNRILMEINDATKETVTSGPDTVARENKVQKLSRKLNDWYEALPEQMRDTPENLATYASHGLARLFVAVYGGYYHYNQLLYYQFLHEDSRSSTPSTHYYAQKCKANATALCSIIHAANAIPGCEVLYNMIGHILVVSSSVFIHTLLFGSDEKEIDAARSHLERNFETLVELRKLWPTLEVCFGRLHTFHEVCRNSMNMSFRMDRWMLRFLSDYGNAVEGEKGKNERNIGHWPVQNIGASPENWV